MAVRIRVYPQHGGMMGGMGMGGMGAVSASSFYNQKLQSQQQVSNLRLGYERALWNERLEKVRLEERLKNPYLGAAGGFAGAYGGLPIGGAPMGVPMGMPMGIPMGGLPMGAVPGAFGGSGQTNITNQTATGAANQRVSNANTYNVLSTVQNPFGGGGWPFGGGLGFGGGGGFLSGLLGALI